MGAWELLSNLTIKSYAMKEISFFVPYVMSDQDHPWQTSPLQILITLILSQYLVGSSGVAAIFRRGMDSFFSSTEAEDKEGTCGKRREDRQSKTLAH